MRAIGCPKVYELLTADEMNSSRKRILLANRSQRVVDLVKKTLAGSGESPKLTNRCSEGVVSYQFEDKAGLIVELEGDRVLAYRGTLQDFFDNLTLEDLDSAYQGDSSHIQ